MSSTDEPEGGSAEDQAYFRTLEQRVLALRGRATLLAADDWTTARAWRRSGIPVELVVEVMEELFARQRERGSRRGISTLRYFRAAVEAAWSERLELEAGGWKVAKLPVLAPAERLAALAESLPGTLPGREELQQRILALDGDVEGIEAQLAELDRTVLEQLALMLDEAERSALRERAGHAAALASAALPRDQVEAARRRLEQRALRERFGLPLLSLFSPEALPREEPD